MAKIEYELFAKTGSYQDGDGRDRILTRKVGEIWAHSDGRRYIRLDPFFNFAGVERKTGADSIFIQMKRTGEGKGNA